MDGDTDTLALTETKKRGEKSPIFPVVAPTSIIIQEAQDVSPRKRQTNPDDETKEFPVFQPRPSQWVVDLVYAVKSVGLVTTVVLVFLWFVPSGATATLDNVVKPVVTSQIEKDHALTATLESNQQQTREVLKSLVGVMQTKHQDELTTQMLLRELRDELRANRRAEP